MCHYLNHIALGFPKTKANPGWLQDISEVKQLQLLEVRDDTDDTQQAHEIIPKIQVSPKKK